MRGLRGSDEVWAPGDSSSNEPEMTRGDQIYFECYSTVIALEIVKQRMQIEAVNYMYHDTRKE